MAIDKLKNIIKNNYVKYGIILVIGLFLGWLIFGGASVPHTHEGEQHSHEQEEAQVWTCSMHPQIRQDKPGKCPLCAMDLIPLKTSGSGDEMIDPSAIQMSKEAVALANIQTTVVSKENPIKNIQLYGTVQADERLSQSQTSHVNGRIEKLFVNFTGESVRQGQTIATIYSPDLLNAQQELLEALKMQDVSPVLIQAAREKLRLWKLSDEQIARIEESGNASPLVEIKANTSGIVTSKNVSEGDYVSQGGVLFDISNLSRVWVVFDAYESDLPFLKVGDKLEYTLQALPGKVFKEKISFINPIMDPTTRTAKIRVETSNPNMQLKPEMYASANVSSPLKQYNNQIIVPKSAVLWTGKRSIVYVKQPHVESPAFMLREVDLGPSLGESYVITSGINDGEEIVTNGTFIVDASAQLEGKRSMMNNSEGVAAVGHSHGDHGVHATDAKTEHAAIHVQGNCDMCKETIEKTAKAIKGVASAHWDKEAKQLHLDFNPKHTSTEAISKAVAKVGYDTDKFKADQSVYDALPPCCKYR